MLSIQNLTKVFKTKQEDVTAVDQINLHIKRGEIFGVIGYSGAGKSTFIRLLNRLEEPTSGEVIIDGKNITKLKGKHLRTELQNIGMVFQHFNLLWSRTVRENIAYPLEIAGIKKEERRRRVDELVELVGLSHRKNAYPSELSGGEKQRVGIARALANNPSVLLCDEATSALDPETTDSILDLLVEINQQLNLTIIMITHEMHVIQKVCHRVAVMESGRVIESGDVLDVFSSPKEQVTQRFIKQIMGEEETDLQAIFEEKGPNDQMIRLQFIGEETNKSFINHLIRTFSVDISIIHGKITQTKKGQYGSLIILLQGEKVEREKALHYIQQETEIEAEVLASE